MGYHEFKLKNYEHALYHVDRSLEYNPLYGDPLLIKLEILFHYKQYKECLDILTILYYDIDINVEQEKKIIDFNSRFYDQVYHLGDSLVIEDRATEAFKLFGILETFCHIMPSGYCNDDYYHGILRSKSGVYESYLKIASVARERKNFEMEKRFLQYAQDYLNENPEIADQGKPQPSEQLSYSTPEAKPFFNTSVSPGEITVTAVNPPIQTLPNPVVEENRSQSQPNTHTASPDAPTVREGDKNEETATVLAAPQMFLNQKEEKKENQKVENTPNEITQTPVEEPVDPMKEYKKYQDLILEGLVMCINEEFEEAYQKFSAAKALESCDCFELDARVDIFLRELKKLDIKK
jgi:tetratricopeptide (TPR) repeat protein